MSVELSDNLNVDFINNLGSIEAAKLSSISGNSFFKVLTTAYGESTVQAAVASIFKASDTAYTGMKDFKDRISNSFLPGGKLSGADQVYLNNYCQRLFSPQSK